MAADRAGAPPRAWQRMLSGRRLDLLDPSPLDIEISDIAHGLARVARWNGQTSGEHAFSVAQHSLLVEALFNELAPQASADDQLAALLHDAPEYVIGDMISPFKSVMGGSYKDCELRLQRAIHLRFSLPPEPAAALRREIKRADQIAAYFEATLLAGFSTAEATEFFGRPRGFSAERFDFTPRSVTSAQNAFLKRFSGIEKSRRPVATSAVG
ncbi:MULTISPECIES: HD family hydrolase [Mesorhizobium]|uniref:Hydrolase n=1 Tax=Rhizobium loti TaxID=381 RepID=A0A6M7U7Y8_RHILI|nr:MULTISPECIES: HD family hydrolase [Mesorhizobium]KRB31966.1 hydrolase [Mesorhizobium sp. Root172]OBQ71996.1 hydrolase [Mesorhizobium loti]QKC72418.1 HD family hydrolase [Mesorhizobium loti]TPN01538.1 HD family hydrolase [Mesorhizobium sp. B2-1-3A]